jgi:DNA invertase Pin-like site-specific DNA recombinase
MKIVSYLRVSTDKQGIRGLGIEAQREAVRKAYGEPFIEFVEVASGKKDNRKILNEAIDFCKRNDGTLIIAKFDRLSRNVAFIANLMESKVPFKAVDMPDANNLTIHIIAAMAQHEREMISARTKAALDVKKARMLKIDPNFKLGNPNAKTAILENRKNRVYDKPDSGKIDTLKTLKKAGEPIGKIQNVAYQLFGKQLSKVTIYKYLKS